MNATKPSTNDAPDHQHFLSRDQLAHRWSVSNETIKRREREGLLSPIRFNQRLLRYRVEEVEAVERMMAS